MRRCHLSIIGNRLKYHFTTKLCHYQVGSGSAKMVVVIFPPTYCQTTTKPTTKALVLRVYQLVVLFPVRVQIRSMDEVHRYLRLTGCQLGVGLFLFDHCVYCFTEFDPEVIYILLNCSLTFLDRSLHSAQLTHL